MLATVVLVSVQNYILYWTFDNGLSQWLDDELHNTPPHRHQPGVLAIYQLEHEGLNIKVGPINLWVQDQSQVRHQLNMFAFEQGVYNFTVTLCILMCLTLVGVISGYMTS